MSTEINPLDPRKSKLNDLKAMHDHNATIHMMYSSRFQFYAEEFVAVQQIISFCKNMCENLKVEIEKLDCEIQKDEI